MKYERYQKFRQETYQMLVKAEDATFELMDSVMTTKNAGCLSERWSDLMPLMTWQLWLAKDLVQENHLPWQSQEKNLTPGRVAQSIFSLLIEIGTPASLPKTRGKPPGWKTGKKRSQKNKYPIVKKSYSRPKKSKIKAS